MRTNLDTFHTISAPRGLFGRDAELDALHTWVASDLPSAALIGAPGVGKTAVLRHFGASCVARHADRFDEVWWCDLVGLDSMAAIVARIADVTGAPAADVGDLGRAAGSLVAALARRGRVLLLLDGTDHVVVPSRDTLPAAVFSSPNLRWALTSRVTTGIADRRMYLRPLAPAAAVALLRASGEGAGADGLDDAPDELAALAEQLDRLPLALELGGRWLGTLTPRQLITALTRHDDFLAGDSWEAGLRAALAETWARATDSDRASATALCAVARDVTVEMASALLGCDVPEAARRLRRLQWLSLIWASSPGGRRRFSTYFAVRGFILERADPEALDAARERLARWLADSFEGWSLAARREESATLGVAFDWAITANVSLAARLALASLTMAEDGDAFADRLRQLSRALERVLETPPFDTRVAAHLYLAIGRGHLLARDAIGAGEALEEARALCGELEDADVLRGRIAAGLARVSLLAGRLAQAREHARLATSLADAAGDVTSRIEALGVLAFAHAECFEKDAADSTCQQIQRDSVWRGREADLALADAVAYRLVALTGAVERLVERPRPGASPREVADFWHQRGETLLALGRLDGARAAFTAIIDDSGLGHDARLIHVTAGGHAAVDAVSAHGAADPRPLAALTRYYEAGAWRYLETRSRLMWGATLALAGRPRQGWRQLGRALDDAGALGMLAHREAFRWIGAVVAHLAGESEAAAALLSGGAASDDPGAPGWLAHSRALARAVIDERPLPAPAARERWTQLGMRRLATTTRLHEEAEAAPAPAPPELEIGPDWRWFRVRGGSELSLARRHAARRILRALVERHGEGSGAPLDRDALLRVGWPDEVMRHDSGVARVHTTLWRLRQLGLAELLVSDDVGYRLREDATIAVAPPG